MYSDKAYFLDNVICEFGDHCKNDTELSRYIFIANFYLGITVYSPEMLKRLIDSLLDLVQQIPVTADQAKSTCLISFNYENMVLLNYAFISSRVKYDPSLKIIQWNPKVTTLDPCLGFTVTIEEFMNQICAISDFLKMK